MQLVPFMLSAVTDYITSPYTAWFPVVVIAAVAMIGIVVAIYYMSALVGREGLRVWAKIKIYELLISLLLIGLFIFLATMLFSINFQEVFGSIGLVPNACVSPPPPLGTDLFSLALCNMHQFNQNLLNLNQLVYFIALRLSFAPQLNINAEALITQLTGITGIGGQIAFASPTALSTFTGYLVNALYLGFVLSQVQLLLLGGSLLFFSVFMALGLISRMFSITRSFGGAMIAFGMGFGIVYPLVICITYGYINVGLDANSAIFGVGAGLTLVFGIFGALFSAYLSIIGLPAIGTLMTNFAIFLGLATLGLTIIPFLNFVVVDVFITDFSSVIGEKMDFLSLLTRIV